MTHDTQVHSLMEELMDAYASAHTFYYEQASTKDDQERGKKRMDAAKEGASHLLKGQVSHRRSRNTSTGAFWTCIPTRSTPKGPAEISEAP